MNDTTTETQPKAYSYSSWRDRLGRAAWYDDQTHRYISRRTLIARTGLPAAHVADFENGRDGRQYRRPRAEREAIEAKYGVRLY